MRFFWKQDEKALEQIIFHSARIQNSQEARDVILKRMYLSHIRGICRANGVDEEKLISGMLCLGESDNGVMLFEEVQKLIKSCRP